MKAPGTAKRTTFLPANSEVPILASTCWRVEVGVWDKG